MKRNRTPHPIRLLGLALLAVPLAMVACSDDSRDAIEDDSRTAVSEVDEVLDDAGQEAVEFAARNLATEQGEEQFNDAGHPIDGKLTCTAELLADADSIVIDCTGTTEAGGVATLIGTTSEIPAGSLVSLEGEFVGLVDAAEVFTTTSLGG